jgi:tetratricopeptide (TPR) repeat protein
MLRWAPALLVLLGLAAWHSVLRNGFVYDDAILIVDNQAIRSLTPLTKFLAAEAQYDGAAATRHTWRPLSVLAYALAYKAAGLNAFVFHLTSVALHILDALLVFGLILALTKLRETAFITAAVFLLHPVQVESVAFAGSMSNSLYLFFYLLSLLLFLRHLDTSSRAERGLSLGAFALALLSKEMAVTLPLVLWLCLSLRARMDKNKSSPPVLSWLPPFVALTAVYVLARSFALGRTAQSGYWAGGPWPQALTMLKGFALYVKLALAPHPLSLEYLFPVKRMVDGEVLFSGTLLAGLFVWGLRRRRDNPRLGFGILIFFLALAPVSNIVPVNTIINERYLYLSMAAWGLIVSAAASWLKTLEVPEGWSAGRWSVVGVSVLLSCYMALTINRSSDWKDEYSLAGANLKTCPHSARVHSALAKAAAERGYWQEAIEQNRAALLIDAYADAKALDDLRGVEPATDLELAAAAAARLSLQTRVDRAQIYSNLGFCHLQKGDCPKAAAYYELSQRLAPADETRRRLADARSCKADPGQNLELASKRSGGAAAAFERGNRRLSKGQYAAAIKDLAAAASADPMNPDILNNLAAAYGMSGDVKKAIELSERAVSTRPEQLKSRYNLALYYRAAGDIHKAQDALRGILKLAPGYAPAREELDDLKKIPPQAPPPAPPAATLLPDALASVEAQTVKFIRETFPQVAVKFDAAMGREYEPAALAYGGTSIPGYKPAVGYMGSSQHVGILRPEEMLALEDLARRERASARSAPSFFLPRAFGTASIELSADYRIDMTPASPRASSVTVRLEPGALVYSQAYAQTDVLYVLRQGELEKMYLIRRKALENADGFTDRLEGNENIKEFKLDGGRLAVISRKTNSAALELTPPVVFDRRGKTAPGRYELRHENGRSWLLTLSFDDAGLEYPLLIDPTWRSAS